MRNAAVLLTILALACGDYTTPKGDRPDPNPISVRGWIEDVERVAAAGEVRTVETEAARRRQLFQQTSVWVENAGYVSGGVAENGAFILLDVPPGNVTISFNAPGAETSKLVLQNIPGNADVFVPGLVLRKTSSDVVNPNQIRVRLPSNVQESTATKTIAVVDGHQVPVLEAPLSALVDRRDYPIPPSGLQPVAKVR